MSQNTKLRVLAIALALATAVALALRPARAQESLDQRYQRALDSFNGAKMEDACELFQGIDKESEGYKQTKTYLKAACDQTNKMRKREEDLYNEGLQLFGQNNLDDARQKFEQAGKTTLKHPKYKDQIARYLKEIDNRQGEEKRFQHCVDLNNQQKFDEAQGCFTQVAQGGGRHASEARDALGRIAGLLGKQKAQEEIVKTFDEGVRLFKVRNYPGASGAFQKVVQAGGPKADEARNYLQRIDRVIQAQNRRTQAGNEGGSKKQADQTSSSGSSEGSGKAGADDGALRAGLAAYFQGQIDDAERQLSDYIKSNGQKQGLAYFFRGATHSTRYFLSGEKDSHEKDLAVADFRALKDHAAQFQPPQRYVSPKILAMYTEAVGGAAP